MTHRVLSAILATPEYDLYALVESVERRETNRLLNLPGLPTLDDLRALRTCRGVVRVSASRCWDAARDFPTEEMRHDEGLYHARLEFWQAVFTSAEAQFDSACDAVRQALRTQREARKAGVAQ